MKGVRCPSCGSAATSVIDKRASPAGKNWRRRRCDNKACGDHFTTYEVVAMPRVVLRRARLVAMRQEGMNYDEIARRFGVSTSTAWKKINGDDPLQVRVRPPV